MCAPSDGNQLDKVVFRLLFRRSGPHPSSLVADPRLRAASARSWRCCCTGCCSYCSASSLQQTKNKSFRQNLFHPDAIRQHLLTVNFASLRPTSLKGSDSITYYYEEKTEVANKSPLFSVGKKLGKKNPLTAEKEEREKGETEKVTTKQETRLLRLYSGGKQEAFITSV